MCNELRSIVNFPAPMMSQATNSAVIEEHSSLAAGDHRQILRVDPCSAGLWRALVQKYQSSLFHSPAWLQVLSDTYDFEIVADVLVDENGSPRAGIPICQISDLRGERRVTLPFSDYCDPLVSTSAEWQVLTASILATPTRYMIRCLHNDIPLTDLRFARFNQAKWHGLDLNADLETIWRSLHGSARRAIRKAQKSQVEIRAAQSKADLRAFYELHLNVRKYKYRMVAQPYAFFDNIWDQFVEAGKGLLLQAYCQGELAAGVLLLEWRNTLVYKFNASSVAYLGARPNDFLLWESMRYGKSRQLTYFDFGLSDWDQEGLINYKRKYANDEKTISFLGTADSQPTVQEEQLRQLLPQLTQLLTEECIPDGVTERAGDILYRYFS